VLVIFILEARFAFKTEMRLLAASPTYSEKKHKARDKIAISSRACVVDPV